MNPTTASDTIVQEITIKGAAERIFRGVDEPRGAPEVVGRSRGKIPPHQFDSDLRPGGKWIMRFDAYGKVVTIRGEYRDIEPPHLLVFTWLPDWYENATESLVRWDLEEHDGVTTVRLTHSGLLTESARENHRGWPQILGWLQAYIE